MGKTNILGLDFVLGKDKFIYYQCDGFHWFISAETVAEVFVVGLSELMQ